MRSPARRFAKTSVKSSQRSLEFFHQSLGGDPESCSCPGSPSETGELRAVWSGCSHVPVQAVPSLPTPWPLGFVCHQHGKTRPESLIWDGGRGCSFFPCYVIATCKYNICLQILIYYIWNESNCWLLKSLHYSWVAKPLTEVISIQYR